MYIEILSIAILQKMNFHNNFKTIELVLNGKNIKSFLVLVLFFNVSISSSKQNVTLKKIMFEQYFSFVKTFESHVRRVFFAN